MISVVRHQELVVLQGIDFSIFLTIHQNNRLMKKTTNVFNEAYNVIAGIVLYLEISQLTKSVNFSVF